MGPTRSLRKLARLLLSQEAHGQAKRQRNPSDLQVKRRAESLADWSHTYRWVARAAQYDQEQAELLAEERRSEILRLDRELAQLGEHLRERGVERAEAMLDADEMAWREYCLAAQRWHDGVVRGELPRDTEPPRPPRPIYGAAAINELIELGIMTERTARGVAAQIQEQRLAGAMGVNVDGRVDVEHHHSGVLGLRLTAEDLAEMERRAIEEMPARHAAMGFLPPDYDGPEPWELAMQERAARSAQGQGQGPLQVVVGALPPGTPGGAALETDAGPGHPEEGAIGAAGLGSDPDPSREAAAQDADAQEPSATRATPAADGAAPLLPSWSTPATPRIRYGVPSPSWGSPRGRRGG
jgi:hypothetical protein